MPPSLTSRRRRAFVAAAIAAVCLLGVSAALAAMPGPYKGKSEQNITVTFKIRDGKVRNFSGGIRLYCFNYGEPATSEYDSVIPPRALALRNGRFKYVGEDRHGADIEIHGRFVAPRRAKGSIQMGRGNCSAKARFTATRRG